MKKGLYDLLVARGLVDNVTSEELKVRIQTPCKLYLGIDPTASSLHLGHLAGLSVAKWFLDYGHSVVILIGGATARVGDPSGKSLERPLLELEEVSSNAQALMDQVKAILGQHAHIEFVDNYDWFSGLNLLNFLRDIGKHFRLGVMLAKDSVKNRLYSEEGISFTEFSYQMLQAYDFLVLFENNGVELQIGGSDQWGNITAGTDLIRKVLKKEAHGLTFPLLTRSDGKKFGKSESGAVWLSKEKGSSFDLYQYLYRVPDADVINLLLKLTHLPLEEIQQLEEGMQGRDPVNTAQKKLAETLVRWIHSEKGLQEALELTAGLQPGKEGKLEVSDLSKWHALEKGPSFNKEAMLGKKFADLFFEVGLAPSRSEATRLIKNGGAYCNNEKIEDTALKLEPQHLIENQYLLLAAGKKNKRVIHLY